MITRDLVISVYGRVVEDEYDDEELVTEEIRIPMDEIDTKLPPLNSTKNQDIVNEDGESLNDLLVDDIGYEYGIVVEWHRDYDEDEDVDILEFNLASHSFDSSHDLDACVKHIGETIVSWARGEG